MQFNFAKKIIFLSTFRRFLVINSTNKLPRGFVRYRTAIKLINSLTETLAILYWSGFQAIRKFKKKLISG